MWWHCCLEGREIVAQWQLTDEEFALIVAICGGYTDDRSFALHLTLRRPCVRAMIHALIGPVPGCADGLVTATVVGLSVTQPEQMFDIHVTALGQQVCDRQTKFFEC